MLLTNQLQACVKFHWQCPCALRRTLDHNLKQICGQRTWQMSLLVGLRAVTYCRYFLDLRRRHFSCANSVLSANVADPFSSSCRISLPSFVALRAATSASVSSWLLPSTSVALFCTRLLSDGGHTLFWCEGSSLGIGATLGRMCAQDSKGKDAESRKSS